MTAKRIFLTGASGCIGHYIAETLIQETDHELFLLVRDPGKLKFNPEARPGITILKADLRDIEQFRNILQTIEVAILAATAWGGSGAVFDINVIKTIRLMNLLNPAVCEQVLYFSTASILNRNNQLLPEAGQMGTDYIRSKYDCFRQLHRLAIAPKITTLYPTLVLGGDANHPYSHLSSGLAGVVKWINLIRFFKVDAGFHFIHAKDIAEVVRYLVDNPPIAEIPGNVSENSLRKKVLGVPAITVNQAVEEICAYLGKRIYFRIPLTMALANFFIALFRVQMAPWDRFCLNYRHFTHQEPVTPSTYGLPTYCATFADVLGIHGISPRENLARAETQVILPTEESPYVTEDPPQTADREESSQLIEEAPQTTTENLLRKEESPRFVEEQSATIIQEESLSRVEEAPQTTTENLLTKEESPRFVEEQSATIIQEESFDRIEKQSQTITSEQSLSFVEKQPQTVENFSTPEEFPDIIEIEKHSETITPEIPASNDSAPPIEGEENGEADNSAPKAKELGTDEALAPPERLTDESLEKPPSVALEDLPFLDPQLRQKKSEPV